MQPRSRDLEAPGWTLLRAFGLAAAALAAAAAGAENAVPAGPPPGLAGPPLELAAPAAPGGQAPFPAGTAGPIAGGAATRSAFQGWLRHWRGTYADAGGANTEPATPSLHGVRPKVVADDRGAPMPQELGYALMVEGFLAAAGDEAALENGLSLLRSWLEPSSQDPEGGPSTGADVDAVLGAAYLSEALGHPDDLVEVVMHALITYAAVDLGFPDVYRTLPDGTRVFLAKGGWRWGGLQLEGGPQEAAWCYTPSGFSPGHLRALRDFASEHWAPRFDGLLPARLDKSPTSLDELKASFDGAIVAGYNILYYASCESGAVSNWVGVKAECADGAASCDGVPWASTPFVGEAGACSLSGSPFGSFGPDAAQTPWRVALDYALFPEESSEVFVYTRQGALDEGARFGAAPYLRRLSAQYRHSAQCDGGQPDSCVLRGRVAAPLLAQAFEPGAPALTCQAVPLRGHDWWASFMSYPTFTAFVVPADDLSREQGSAWLDTLASLCTFSDGGEPSGYLCSTSMFELDQELVSTMIMAGAVQPPKPARAAQRPGGATGPAAAADGRAGEMPAEASSSGKHKAKHSAFVSASGSDLQGEAFPAAAEIASEEQDNEEAQVQAAEEFKRARRDGDEAAAANAVIDFHAAKEAFQKEEALRKQEKALEEEQSEEVYREVEDARAEEIKEEEDEEEQTKALMEFQKAKDSGDQGAQERAVSRFEEAGAALEEQEARKELEEELHHEEEEALHQEELALTKEAEADSRRFPRKSSAAAEAEAVRHGRFPRKDGLRGAARPAGGAAADGGVGPGLGFCCLHADSVGDFCGSCHPRAVTSPDSWCSSNEDNCKACGTYAQWCGTQPPASAFVQGVIEDVSLRHQGPLTIEATAPRGAAAAAGRREPPLWLLAPAVVAAAAVAAVACAACSQASPRRRDLGAYVLAVSEPATAAPGAEALAGGGSREA